MSEIAFPKFGCLLCQNCPVIKDHNPGRIRNHFPTWIEVSISYLDKETQEMNFFGIPRASRPLLISINRPLNIEERHTAT